MRKKDDSRKVGSAAALSAATTGKYHNFDQDSPFVSKQKNSFSHFINWYTTFIDRNVPSLSNYKDRLSCG